MQGWVDQVVRGPVHVRAHVWRRPPGAWGLCALPRGGSQGLECFSGALVRGGAGAAGDRQSQCALGCGYGAHVRSNGDLVENAYAAPWRLW